MAFEAFLSETRARPRRLTLLGYATSLVIHVPPVVVFVFLWLTHHVIIGHSGDTTVASAGGGTYWVPIIMFSDPAGRGRGLGRGDAVGMAAAPGHGIGRAGAPGALGGVRVRRARPLHQPHHASVLPRKAARGPEVLEAAARGELDVDGHDTGLDADLALALGLGVGPGAPVGLGTGPGGLGAAGTGTGAGTEGVGAGAEGTPGAGAGGKDGEGLGGGVALPTPPKPARARGDRTGEKDGRSAGTADGAGAGATEGDGVDLGALGAKLPASVRSPIISENVAAYLRTYDHYPNMPESFYGGRWSLRFVLYICVSAEGTVSEVLVRQGVDPEVDSLVTDAVRTWRYRPRQVAGAPHPFCHPIGIEYTRRMPFAR